MNTMNLYRKYTWYALAVLLAFIAVNWAVWTCGTGILFNRNFKGGDLSRMGYLPDSKLLRQNIDDLPLRHWEESGYRGLPVRVLTIGDSFSNGGGGGKNRYYQDYIASISRCGVLNFEPYQNLDILSLITVLCNNGYLDRLRPKYLIFGASEKFCIAQYAKPLDSAKTLTMEQLNAMKRMGYNAASGPKVSFINTGNFKYLLNSLLYRFSDNAFFSKVYVRRLSRPLFSARDDDRLLWYRDDTRNTSLVTPGTVALLNKNLNTLADMLAKKGIRLYFLPCVDKYNLYSEFIVDNTYPRSTFFEELRKAPKRYTVIDTKELLLGEVRRGEKDVFYPDDTHWSWKASKKIFETVRFD
jgi:hypothetical protein